MARQVEEQLTDIRVSVVVVSYNSAHLLTEMTDCLDMALSEYSSEIIFIDNNSVDTSVDVIRSNCGGARLIENSSNVGFGRANNQALPFLHGSYVLLINTDAFIPPDALSKTVAYMDANPKCGILGVRLEGRDGVLQPCCRNFPTPWNTFIFRTGLSRIFKNVKLVDDMAWDHSSVRHCDWVVGCFYLIRKEVIDQIGLFDPRYFLYFEEVDHCFAAKKAGWDVVFYPHTTVVHIGGESAKSIGSITKGGRQLEAMQVESELLYFRKNHGVSAVFYSLFLSILAECINAAKAAAKGKLSAVVGSHWQRGMLVCRLFLRTRAGTVPTR